MHQLIQAAGIGPPAFDATPFWIGFWITGAVILVVVAFVGTIIMLVNRIEYQASATVMQLAAVKDNTSPLTALPAANAHLAAIGKAVLGVVAAKQANP